MGRNTADPLTLRGKITNLDREIAWEVQKSEPDSQRIRQLQEKKVFLAGKLRRIKRAEREAREKNQEAHSIREKGLFGKIQGLKAPKRRRAR